MTSSNGTRPDARIPKMPIASNQDLSMKHLIEQQMSNIIATEFPDAGAWRPTFYVETSDAGFNIVFENQESRDWLFEWQRRNNPEMPKIKEVKPMNRSERRKTRAIKW